VAAFLVALGAVGCVVALIFWPVWAAAEYVSKGFLRR
jgi:hypothetical protein